MRFSVKNLFKKLFGRQKQQPFAQPERGQEKEQPQTGMFQPRKKPPGRHILTHNRIIRTKSKKVWKRRAKNKMARRSRQINRAA